MEMPGMGLTLGNATARSRNGSPRRTEKFFVTMGDSGDVTS